jgi:hypothetical protein
MLSAAEVIWVLNAQNKRKLVADKIIFLATSDKTAALHPKIARHSSPT